MKKNVSGQKIGAQMVSASDGSAFTGSVTVYVTGDAGTQAAGSVGSGACTHEGNGYHTYAPAQAETNYDLAAFTFIGTGAVPATVQVYTGFPQTVDNATNIAAIKAVTDVLPDSGALTSIATAAALATVDSNVDAILIDTAEIGTAGAGLSVLATQSLLSTVAGYLDTEIAAIKAKTDNLPASPAAVSDIPTAGAVADAVWDEAIGGHSGSGSTGEALAAAGASGDPWITALPGSYTAGQAGYIIGTNLDAQVSTAGGGLDAAGVRAALGMASADLDTQLDAIVADTGEIGTAGAGLTALATVANLATVAGYIDTEVAAIKAVTDALPNAGALTTIQADLDDIQTRLPAALVSGRMSSDLVSIGGSTTALSAFKRAVQGNVIATASTGCTTTSITTSSMTPAASVTDQLKGRILTFADDTTTAALRGQATDITGSTASGTPTLTVTALTTAPASGDTFTIT